MNRINEEQPHDPGQLKRFAIGSEVRLKVPGMTGIVRHVGFQLGRLGEYWHEIEFFLDGQSEFRQEPGCNLELTQLPRRKATPVLDEVREYAISLKDTVQRTEILKRIEALEISRNTARWPETYQAFTAFTSEHPVTQKWVVPLLDKLESWRLRQLRTAMKRHNT